MAPLKDSTLGHVISYPELVTQGNNLLIQTYLIVAVIYVVVDVALSRPAVWLERRMGTRVLRNAARAEPPEPRPRRWRDGAAGYAPRSRWT